MNTLLIYFAFPLAVIIFSVILEKLINSPIAVSALIFAIFLIITFAAFDATFLIATLAYTILALISASIIYFLKQKYQSNGEIYNMLAEIKQSSNTNDNIIENEYETNNCSMGRQQVHLKRI